MINNFADNVISFHLNWVTLVGFKHQIINEILKCMTYLKGVIS